MGHNARLSTAVSTAPGTRKAHSPLTGITISFPANKESEDCLLIKFKVHLSEERKQNTLSVGNPFLLSSEVTFSFKTIYHLS